MMVINPRPNPLASVLNALSDFIFGAFRTDIAPKEIFLKIPAKLMITPEMVCERSVLVRNVVDK